MARTRHARTFRAHRKGSHSVHRKGKRFAQRGGDGYGYTGAAFTPAGSMAPIESRAAFSHCGFPARPGSMVGGACGSCSAPAVLMGQAQVGGGGGTGGYGFDITNNDLGKVYSSLSVGSCPGQKGGASMADTRIVDSYPAGYGYGPESVREINNGTAHYLDQISYGRQCMGGGYRRTSRAHRKGSRSAGRSARHTSRKRSTHRK